ncbi:MAG: hypothetical protein IH840_00790 [Candidatus Heimdallarchaeota archaeon]|nr:hypothetical protein [Candidatus Heimdallarchaeota archaeon]
MIYNNTRFASTPATNSIAFIRNAWVSFLRKPSTTLFAASFSTDNRSSAAVTMEPAVKSVRITLQKDYKHVSKIMSTSFVPLAAAIYHGRALGSYLEHVLPSVTFLHVAVIVFFHRSLKPGHILYA